jgi:3,4-dehydroadipyl-CoA semialdehyde dehydrogenase
MRSLRSSSLQGGEYVTLPNYVSGRWSEGLGAGEVLFDPVMGDELASITSQGIDLEAALKFARAHGGPALRQLTNDANFTRDTVLGIGDLHGRVLVMDSTVGNQHTGHGNVVPSCLHGGPGRAGGGEELAGLRALLLYHRRLAVQGPANCTRELSGFCVDTAPLYS